MLVDLESPIRVKNFFVRKLTKGNLMRTLPENDFTVQTLHSFNEMSTKRLSDLHRKSTMSLSNLRLSLSKLTHPLHKEKRKDPSFFSKTSLLQLGYGIWVNLSSLAIGLAAGFAAVAVPQIKAPNSPLKATLSDEAWIASVLALTAPIGSLLCGYCIDIIGRRLPLILGHVPLAVGWLMCGFATLPVHLIIGRLISGFGVGLLMIPCRVYVMEISLPNMRGILGTLINVTMAFGLVVQSLMGNQVKWHDNSFICAGISIGLTIANFFLPETPYYVLQKKEEPEVYESLKNFRAKNYEYFDDEMDELMDFKMDNVHTLTYKQWLEIMISPSSVKPFCLMVPYMILCQLAGINVLFTYDVEMLKESESSVDPNLGGVVLSLTRFFGAILSAAMVFNFGRRTLSLASAIGCGVVFVYLGSYLHFDPSLSVQPLIWYTIYAIFACLGYYPLVLLILFELLPLQARGIMGGFGQALMQFGVFVTNKIFPFMKKGIHLSNTLILMGVFSLICVTVTYRRGLPVMTVPLPSRRERCRFTLRPVSQTVGDLLEQVKAEDRGVERAVCLAANERVRIAASDTVESLLEDDFRLLINDTEYLVKTPPQERLSTEEITRLSDVRNLVNQLYEALNVREHQIRKERELRGQLEKITTELQPLEEKRQYLEVETTRKTSLLTWVGLGLMGVQFGVLARLTWWEYSWDIMEPVTYFVTYGTAMALYAYFVLTKQEYILPDVKDRQHLLTLHKKAKKIGLDIKHYNHLKDEVSKLEKDLARLRDPLNIHLPPSYVNRTLEDKRSPLTKIKDMLEETGRKMKIT